MISLAAPATSISRTRFSIGFIGLSVLLAGCSSYGGLSRETMAACISEAGITGPYAASSSLRNNRMTFVVRPGPNVSAAQAATANACIGRTIDTPLASAQPGTGQLEQRSVVATDGSTTTKTFTYGRPPAASAQYADAPMSSSRPRRCNLQMTGGSGYMCRSR